MPKPQHSSEASISIINSYCNERHNGKLVCAMDPVKGRTLYAKESFAVGELILEEPPLHAVRLQPENPACARLMDLCESASFKHPAIWYWCALNSVLVDGDPPVEGLQAITRRQWKLLRILFVPHVVQASPEATHLVEYMGLRGIVDEIDLEIMFQVWFHNCFEHHRDPEGYVIYFMPSFCSHSCLPNALWCTDGNSNFRFFPRATIRAGDEITLTYLSEEDMVCSTAHRRALLEGAKDFKCMCESSDEMGSKTEFRGALLTSLECGPIHESATHNPYDSHIPDERGPNSWRQALVPQSLHASGERDSAALLSGKESARKPNSINVYTIWVRLLNEYEDRRRLAAGSSASGDLRLDSTPLYLEATRGQAPNVARARAGSGIDDNTGLPSDVSKLGALISVQAATRLLQTPRSGCCCMCRASWTECQQQRALAVEKVIEGAFSHLDESDPEPATPPSGSSLAVALSEWATSQMPFLERNEAADERALKILQRVDVFTLLRILNKGWRSLDKHERLVVDSVIRLTFKTHWLAAQWFRFLESNASASRKLPHLDQLVWQYRNLYPGLTPAVAWAVWDIAQALLSLERNSKLRNSMILRRYADQCIVSSYEESVFILCTLFGADSSFVASIVDDYSAAVEECKDKVMRRKAPVWRNEVAAGYPKKDPPAFLPNHFKLPNMWPCYISSCGEASISTPSGSFLIPGRVYMTTCWLRLTRRIIITCESYYDCVNVPAMRE